VSLVETGQRVYNEHCYFCHGYNGDARTVAARYLNPPPRDFTAKNARTLSSARIAHAVTNGIPGSAMQAFTARLTPAQIKAVGAFVRAAFVDRKTHRTVRYHSPENGWYDHAQRYASAYPFVDGRVSLRVPLVELSDEQRAGRDLFLSSCITCHERDDAGAVEFSPRPLSYPRNGVTPQTIDSASAASTYVRSAPPVPPSLQAGATLFQQNCAMCHGADGSGRNWIGQFIEPHAADLRALKLSAQGARAALRARIETGVPGSAMPAWRYVFDTAQLDAVVDYLCGALIRAGCGGRPPLPISRQNH